MAVAENSRDKGQAEHVETSNYDPRYLEGVHWFNEGNFFQAHEVWEELWIECRDPSRTFYQGLIQVAVCLHHFGRRNTRGARKLYHSSRRHLEPFSPWHQGLDVARLLKELEICCGEVAGSEEFFPKARLNVQLVPKIQLSSRPDTLVDEQRDLGNSRG
jgi:uncharacterized protein